MLLTHMDTVDKVLDILILPINVLLTLDHYQLLHTKSHTVKIPCMIHQFKDHAHFIWSHKNHPKCVEEEISLSMDVNVVPQETTANHQLQDVQLDVLS